ncbi:hypothetical protein K1719_029110 [Acacia pycnantha]|nr:hypothetical protein K1719_029110 [Acacia pycnantha]
MAVLLKAKVIEKHAAQLCVLADVWEGILVVARTTLPTIVAPYKTELLESIVLSPLLKLLLRTRKFQIMLKIVTNLTHVKLVKALCSVHNVNLLTVPSVKTLGEWAVWKLVHCAVKKVLLQLRKSPAYGGLAQGEVARTTLPTIVAPYKTELLESIVLSPLLKLLLRTRKFQIMLKIVTNLTHVKLVKALCSVHNVNLLTVPSVKTLGEWAVKKVLLQLRNPGIWRSCSRRSLETCSLCSEEGVVAAEEIPGIWRSCSRRRILEMNMKPIIFVLQHVKSH